MHRREEESKSEAGQNKCVQMTVRQVQRGEHVVKVGQFKYLWSIIHITGEVKKSAGQVEWVEMLWICAEEGWELPGWRKSSEKTNGCSEGGHAEVGVTGGWQRAMICCGDPERRRGA